MSASSNCPLFAAKGVNKAERYHKRRRTVLTQWRPTTNRCAGWDPEWKMQLVVGGHGVKASGDRRWLEGSPKKGKGSWRVNMQGKIENSTRGESFKLR